MPRARINYDPWREFIIERLSNGVAHLDLCNELAEKYGVTISRRTLQRQLAAWNVQTRRQTRTDYRTANNLEDLRVRIAHTFHILRLSDKEACAILEAEGYTIGRQRYARLRKELGLYKRVPAEKQDEAEAAIEAVLKKELDTSVVETYGRRHLYSYLRSKYNVVGRDRVYRVASLLNPEGGERRRPVPPVVHRGTVVTPGPNYAWSMDAYCRLEHWGIEIYAAIDVYSRYIVWIYAGITGCTAESVLAQYVGALSNGGVLPHIIHSNKSPETILAADAHYMLSKDLRGKADTEPISFTDCFQPGTTRGTRRIEAWWNEQSQSLNQWRNFFQELVKLGSFDNKQPADRIAFLAIYVPIIRKEVVAFVHLWNNHRIRKQADRPHLVAGIPHILYHHPQLTEAQHCGTAIPEGAFDTLQGRLEGIDIEEYLPEATLEWCSVALESTGFPSLEHIDGDSSTVDGERLHCGAYQQLRLLVGAHMQSGHEPILQEIEKPLFAKDWQLDAETLNEFASAD